MKAYVAVTDGDWYRHLRRRPGLEEVNFWQPSGSTAFRALEIGQPFLFKLHYPDHAIVGGGFYTHFSLLPSRLAWDIFGEKNGAASYEEMRRRLERYRRRSPDHGSDTIGCIILREPFFLDQKDWIEPPPDWRRNIVRGKGYDLSTPPGSALWQAVYPHLHDSEWKQAAERGEPDEAYAVVLARRRLGQGEFRVVVLDTYEKRCALTGEKVVPVLHAAHIKPVRESGPSRIDNGISLRSDVHLLFDGGYVTVTPDHRFRVSDSLRREFDNGEYYYQFQGMNVWLPPRAEMRPEREFLEWHADTVFRG